MPGRLRCNAPLRAVPPCRACSVCRIMLVHLVEKSSSTRLGAQSSRHCSSSEPGRMGDGHHLVPTWIGIFEWVRCRPVSLCGRSEEHTSELQSLMRISYAVFCLKKKN